MSLKRSTIFRTAVALVAFVLVASIAPEAFAAPPSAPRSAGESPAVSVDINTADATTLMTVPGIGKSLAQRIVDFRQKNGAFTKVDDLVKVQGIGERSLERIRPYLVVAKAK